MVAATAFSVSRNYLLPLGAIVLPALMAFFSGENLKFARITGHPKPFPPFPLSVN